MNFTSEQILSVIDKKEVFKLVNQNCSTLGNTLSEISTKSRFHNYMIELIKNNFGYDMKEIRTINVNGINYRYLEFNHYLLKHLLNEFVQYNLLHKYKEPSKTGLSSNDGYVVTEKGNKWIRQQKQMEATV